MVFDMSSIAWQFVCLQYLFDVFKNLLKNNICIKQTKIEIQNESKTIVATSVSMAVT